MDYNTFSAHLNALVTEFLDKGGDAAECGDLLREIADEVFEEPDEDSTPEAVRQVALW
jgi:phage tail protein X